MRSALAPSSRLAALLIAVCLLLVPFGRAALAHDLPNELVVHSFVKPEGERLSFLLRIPLALLEGMALPKRGPGHLDLARIDEALDRSALAIAREFPLYENGERLTPERAMVQVAQPSNESFASYEEARAHVLGPPLPEATNVFWNQGYLDVYLDFGITSEQSRFTLDIQAGRGLSGVLKLFVQFLPPDGTARVYEVHGGHGWLELDPSWYQAGWTFVQLGFEHILGGIDHLLFLVCLVLPFRLEHLWRLVGVVTSFAIAYSVTLIGALTGAVPTGDWFPPLVESLVALSIVYVAFENIVGAWLNGSAAGALRWRWVIAGAFGLAHGFGFSFGLQEELQYAGAHFLLSVVSFTIGVGVGQLAVLLVVLPLFALAVRSARAQRVGVVLVSALVAHSAWHWMLERADALRFVRWPELGVTWSSLLLGLILVLAVAIAGKHVWHRWRDLQPVVLRRSRL